MATTAAAAETSDEIPAEAGIPAKKGRKGLVLALVGVLVLGGGGAGAFLYMKGSLFGAKTEAGVDGKVAVGKDGKPLAAALPVSYIPLDPAFVVNLEDTDVMRFMQVEVQVAVRDPAVGEEIRTHMPLIRNKLMLLFSGQSFANIATRADKEKLQAQALAEVQGVLKEKTGKPGIEALYFTSLVTQ
jgi:flagellar FliL protein